MGFVFVGREIRGKVFLFRVLFWELEFEELLG